MRLLFISSGTKTLSYLDPNFISAFRELEKASGSAFAFACYHSDRERIQTLYNKIQTFKPDVILSLNRSLTPDTIARLKRYNIPLGLYLVDDPYLITYHLPLARQYQFVITEDSGSVPVYRNHGIKALHLPLAVNPSFYSPMEVSDQYKSDICFVGSALPNRLRLFDELTPYLRKKKFIIIGRWWERLKHFAILKPHILNRTIPPQETAKYYNGAKIVLNIHRIPNDVNRNPRNIPAYTPNNRTFDIAACKAFQLATCRRDLKNYYHLGEEMICYQGIEDLKQKIDYYLQHEAERNEIAERAFARTLEDHTYIVRFQELINKLNNEILANR
ncbi:CgeB family protein [Bacillus rubiinfantis]|uniref:CgeB family protein n=1 Tax=Bacillus rubiinfantis TaxID=1499680 RepID=UPI00069391EE|nr:glycosyltransferase [Bacillus rubiinfantis]